MSKKRKVLIISGIIIGVIIISGIFLCLSGIIRLPELESIVIFNFNAWSDSSEQTEIHQHEYTSKTIPASCAVDGSIEYSCQTCGDSYTEILPCTGHQYSTEKVLPTCTIDGNTLYICNLCHDTYTETHPALGHNYHTETVPATCTNNGSIIETCQICGNTRTEILEAFGHDFETQTTPATCTQAGETKYTCKKCGGSHIDRIEKTGHRYKETVVEATCTESGIRTQTCENCGGIITESIPSKGHLYDTGILTASATCTTNGSKKYTCQSCSHTYTENIPSTGHNYSSIIITATCEDDGYTFYTCSECKHSYRDNLKAALGHKLNSDALCTRCNKDFSVDMISRLGLPISTDEHSVGFAWTQKDHYFYIHWQGKNLSGKKIKYVTFTFKLYNAVNDCVHTNSVKLTGPIMPEEIISISKCVVSELEYMQFIREEIYDIELAKIKLEYDDGSEIGNYGIFATEYTYANYSKT